MNKKVFWIAALLLAWFGRDGARGQQKTPVSSLQEDCSVTFAFSTASSGAQAAGTVTAGSTGTTPVIDNRQAGCLDWIVTYEPTSIVASVSLAFQTATDVGGLPVTWSNYPGTLTSGINPNTAVTTGGAVTEATGTAYPFLRMNMTVLTGGGSIRGKLYGWKHKPTNVTVVSGSTCPPGTPCVVVGNKSNNAVVPGSTNLGVLPGLANAAAPTWTEGDQVLESMDLTGRQRTLSTIAGNTAVLSGQQTVTASAVALASNAAKNVCVKALNGNSAAVFIGPTGITTSTGFRMDPGDVICGPISNTNLNFVIAAAAIGDAVTWYSTN